MGRNAGDSSSARLGRPRRSAGGVDSRLSHDRESTWIFSCATRNVRDLRRRFRKSLALDAGKHKSLLERCEPAETDCGPKSVLRVDDEKDDIAVLLRDLLTHDFKRRFGRIEL